ncbi:glycerol-3-phosphate ABC transporter ATP-binding protein [Rhizobium rhizosphaerae]|uniref:Glycerol-3-phosphate ABC transporter ATP-binding protein n=1 Tax=Xaviernesmea rhizosphaerae TaxID=1672749 RepID=A0ABX3PGP9_9HYPH|nr:ABC transporter ATP-binding protein [Xaviernesmea rhizosphaerae]OQP87235.1 glycerol-3-phosphate ABC transporter ATP-binding protein [Xaviernesmea rhizosphaerae]
MTAQIELTEVNKHYGAYHALKNINLKIAKGSFVALVGPSGCGKSTLLRSLAGLEKITAGRLTIAGDEMTSVPPRKRDIAMVFQSYALYPHMTVEENLVYPLRMRGVSKTEARARAQDVAGFTGLSGLLTRYPRQLSGGQRQRVAMGRAVIRSPKAFLFDEPLSNLDAALRVSMRKEIRALHDRLGATSVYVTHDQIEAMTMADHVVVMKDGVIEQQGAPLTLYDRPENRFVAGFIGSPAMNFVAAHGIDGATIALDLPGRPQIAVSRDGETPLKAGQAVVAGLRPEHLRIAEGEGAGQTGRGVFTLPVRLIESTGSLTYLSLGETGEIALVEHGREQLRPGDRLTLSIDPALVHLFDPQTGRRV